MPHPCIRGLGRRCFSTGAVGGVADLTRALASSGSGAVGQHVQRVHQVAHGLGQFLTAQILRQLAGQHMARRPFPAVLKAIERMVQPLDLQLQFVGLTGLQPGAVRAHLQPSQPGLQALGEV